MTQTHTTNRTTNEEEERTANRIQDLIAQSGISNEKLAAILGIVAGKQQEQPRPRIRREPPPPCTSYKEISKNYTCLHCGNKYSQVIKLTKTEDTTVLNLKGEIQIIDSNSPANIECITSHCARCTEYIAKMTRVELERLYTKLLQATNILSVPTFYGDFLTKVMERNIKL